MKKLILGFMVMLCVVTALPIAVNAQTSGTCGDNLTWSLEGGELVISGSGDMYAYDKTTMPWYECKDSITKVTIEEGVTKIGDYAFYECTNLTSVDIPDSVTVIRTNAFNYSGLTSVTLSENVSAIGGLTFGNCLSLKSIDVSANNTTYSSQDGVLFNKSKTTLMAYPAGKSGVYTIPDSVKSVNNFAFHNCSGLTEVVISGSVTSIGKYAFGYCNGLTNVTIPDSVTEMGERIFYECRGLERIKISDNVTDMGNRIFYNCVNLTDVQMPEGLTKINEYAFSGCSGLENITIPNSVTSIETFAFNLCKGMTSIEVPEGVTAIADYAFSGCNNLTDVYYSESEEKWSAITIGDGNAYLTNADAHCDIIAEGDSGNCTWELYSDGRLVIAGDGDMNNYGETTIPWLDYSNEITSAVIKDSVTTIGNYAFYNCTNLENITIPDGVTYIGRFTFYGCSSLADVIIPDSVTEIGRYAFYGCSSLVSVTISDNVTIIGKYLFTDCKNLVSVTMPDSVTEIDTEGLFKGCSKLASATIPKGATSLSDGVFAQCINMVSVSIPYGITTIGDGAFTSCTALTSITIPDGVTSIGNGAFHSCTGLTDVTIPDSVTTINSGAFMKCLGLVSVKLSDNLTTIAGSAFYDCSSISNIIIPNSVTSINGYAFYDCNNLSSITIPVSVTSIGSWAFYNCNNLTEVFYDGTELQWAAIDIGSNNDCLLNARATGNVTIEIRDAETGELIPDASASAHYKSQGTVEFLRRCDGSTVYRLKFPIDYIYLNVGGSYEFSMQYDILKPSNGKLVLYAYPRGSNYQSRVTGISLVGWSEMTVGETQDIYAAVAPATAWNKAVIWSSSNNSVATVNANGKVTAKASGNVTITAKTQDGGFVDSIDIMIRLAGKGMLNYDNYCYSFPNLGSSFGYPWYGYRIPKERYLQLGWSESVAEQLYNSNKWGGNCFGMSASSILFYKNIMNEKKYDATVDYPYQFDAPDEEWYNEKKLRQMIELLQISQKYNYVQWNTIPFSPSDAGIIADEITRGNPVKLGLRSSAGNHAVVIYGYEKDENTYTFDIYDCSSYVTKLVYTDNDNYYFLYNDNTFRWYLNNYCTYDTLLWAYNTIKNKNANNAASLLSLRGEQKYTYILCESGNITIANSRGQTSTIVDGELSGEIENINLVLDGYLAEDPKYTLIAPTDTYTITGTSDEEVTTILVDDYMSVEVTHKSSVPVTISADLHEIKIENSEESNYTVKYTAYDNVFDEMTVSGTTKGTVNVTLDNAIVNVSGADNIIATASVSSIETTVVANDINNANAVVNCAVNGDSTNLQILVDNIAATEAMQLAERQQMSIPECSVASGEYTEGQTLTFTKDDDTLIYYTTDESIPTKDNGILYTLPIEINQSVTIKAIATKYGYTDSEILELNYTLPNIVPPFVSLATGEYDTIQVVELNHEDGVEIYYTTDVTEPTENGILYNTPITLYEDTVIKAYALKNGVASDVVEYDYQINHKSPIYIGEGIVNQDGELIDSTNLSGLSKITLVASKTATEDETATFIAAFYDEQGRLLKMFSDDYILTESENVIDLSVENISGATKLKIFGWNGLSTLTPIAEAIVIGENEE